MSPTYSALFNLGIESKFNIPQIRKQSVFGSMNSEVATSYVKHSIQRGTTQHGILVQLGVDPSAVIVFNPDVYDSLDLEGAGNDEWWSFLEEHGKVDRNVRYGLEDLYMNSNPHQFFVELVNICQVPAELHEQFMALVQKDAAVMTSGYQLLSADAFAQRYNTTSTSEFECIVSKIDTYIGFLVNDINEQDM